MLALVAVWMNDPAHARNANTHFSENERRLNLAIDRCQLDQIRILVQDVYTLLVGIQGTRFVERAASFSRCIDAIPLLAEAGARIDVPEVLPDGTIYKVWFDAGNAIGHSNYGSVKKYELWDTLLRVYGFPRYYIFKKAISLNIVGLMTAECDRGHTLDDDLIATLQLMTEYSSAEIVRTFALQPANASGKTPFDYAKVYRCPKTLAYLESL